MTDPKPVRPDRAEKEVENRPELAAETIKDLTLSPEWSEDVRAGAQSVGGACCANVGPS